MCNNIVSNVEQNKKKMIFWHCDYNLTEEEKVNISEIIREQSQALKCIYENIENTTTKWERKLHLLKIDYLAAIMLHVLCALTHAGFIIILFLQFLQLLKLRFREVKCPVQFYRARK